MNRKIPDQQKISLLIATVLLFILATMIGFGSSIAYSMARLQASIQDAYTPPFMVSNAGLKAYATLSQLHSYMLKVLLTSDRAEIPGIENKMLNLDQSLHKNLSIIKTVIPGNTGKIDEIERRLDEWKRVRAQLIALVYQEHKDQALQIASVISVQLYSQLETDMDDVVTLAQHHVETLVTEAQTKAAAIVRLVWWYLAGLILSGVFFGILVIRKVGGILEYDRQIMNRLHENEERMKLALSGADEGTWDLSMPEERLNFDDQWGEILGFATEKDRPHNLNEWARLIHIEDRAHVLKALQDHVAGWASEYKAEYRIHSASGALKWVLGHGRAVYRDADGRALRIVGITMDITQKKQTENRIWQLAHSDSLTGLPNRPLFYERLGQSIAQAARHHRKLALLFLDLDGFKQINDQFGHDTGDNLLQEVADRLRQNVREEDTVARIGGDEFIFILNDISDAGNAAIAAQKIIHSLSKPFVIHQNSCQIGGSIGISIFPDDSEQMETLVTQADDAMYKAKKNGKNNYQFFNSPSA
jgi:diguanylate cyclase (GGDEF)-like protein/PAS domain S-box-containing protein